MDIGLSVLAVIRTATSETVSALHYVFINLHVIKCTVQESDSCFFVIWPKSHKYEVYL